MMSVYIASSLHNAPRVRQIQNRLRAAGIAISYDWTVHNQVYSDEELAKYGELEEQGVINCAVFIMIHPARNGSHCELGMARVLGKHIVILEEGPLPEKKTFYYRPDNHQRPIHRFADENKAIDFVLQLLRGASNERRF